MAWHDGNTFDDGVMLSLLNSTKLNSTQLNSTQHKSTPFPTTRTKLNGILVDVPSVTEYGNNEDNTI